MSRYEPERDPVRIAGRALRWVVPWLVLPAAVGVFVSGNIDVRSLPIFGQASGVADCLAWHIANAVTEPVTDSATIRRKDDVPSQSPPDHPPSRRAFARRGVDLMRIPEHSGDDRQR